MTMERHLTEAELSAGLAAVRKSPADHGELLMIVVRPDHELRETPSRGLVTPEEGLVGDRWARYCKRRLPDGRLNPDTQLTLLNAAAAALVTGPRERWPLAGDNLVVDLDLSVANLPAGQRVQVGDAILEITAEPHTGCSKFAARFGADALKFVNSEEGKPLRLRGANAQVIKAGVVKLGDRIQKL